MTYKLDKRLILNSRVSVGSYENFLKRILLLAKENKSSYVCVCNVHMLIEAYKDENFNEIVNTGALVTPDGMPLVKAMKTLHGIDQDRVAGMDLMPDLMRLSEKEKLSVFLYGSTDDVLNKIVLKVQTEFPNLEIYTYSPAFKELSFEEKEYVIKMINSVNPSFVFVALGCPKQEKWMSEHDNKVNSCMIGLGGAFEVYAGIIDRAPKFMQDNALEWLYRLTKDPRRLWKRYLVTNALFIVLFIKQFIKIRVFKIFD